MKGGHEKTPEVTTPTLPLGSVPLTRKVVHILPPRQTGIFHSSMPRIGMVKIENSVDTKMIREANAGSQLYLSARTEVVLPAGIPDIMTQILIRRGSR